MRNLFSFIWKNYFIFTFLLLEVTSFYLIVKHNNFQSTGFFNSSNIVVGNVFKIFNDATDYLYLKTANELLAAENARLLSSYEGSFQKFSDETIEVTDSIYRKKYVYREARVINNTINKRNNYITLDKGRLHGIQPEMGVIAPDGIVGIVKDVSDNFCSVLSLLNKNALISTKLKKSGYLGSLSWNGGNPQMATLNDVPKHAKVAIGDTVISSGASSMFPEGIMIGFIEDINLKPGDNFYTIEIKLSTDFGKLSYVYVVDYLFKQEQQELERASRNDN
jgi:rod shape-determining protein MreC